MKIKKIISTIGIVLMVFIVGITTLILFPQPLFSNSYGYKNFRIYSEYKVNEDQFNVYIDKANELIKASELYDSTYSYDIFLANESFYNKIDDRILGEWSIARAIDNNVIIKNKVHEKLGQVENGNNKFDLDYVLAHEMIHCLQENKYGKRKFNPINHPPMWKLEGYPEYISRKRFLKKEGRSLKLEIQDFLERTKNEENQFSIIQISSNESTPYVYYKSRLLTEYLIEVKGLSYHEILNDKRSEELIYKEMMEWYEK